jgi:hypothetical protein
VVKLETAGFGFKHDAPIFVHRHIREHLVRAFTEIAKTPIRAARARKDYIIKTLNGYQFRYTGTKTTTAHLRSHQRDYVGAERWFKEQLEGKKPGFEWLVDSNVRPERVTWSNSFWARTIAAAYDCYKRGRPQLKLSNHACGLASDINAAANGIAKSWDIAPLRGSGPARPGCRRSTGGAGASRHVPLPGGISSPSCRTTCTSWGSRSPTTARACST